MNGYQTYFVIIILLEAGCQMAKDGQPRENYSFSRWLFNWGLCIPWIGNFLGWW